MTEEKNLVARVYPKSIEVYPRGMKKAYVELLVREEEGWGGRWEIIQSDKRHEQAYVGLLVREETREGRARELEI